MIRNAEEVRSVARNFHFNQVLRSIDMAASSGEFHLLVRTANITAEEMLSLAKKEYKITSVTDKTYGEMIKISWD